jgi:hypothetical protein
MFADVFRPDDEEAKVWTVRSGAETGPAHKCKGEYKKDNIPNFSKTEISGFLPTFFQILIFTDPPGINI